MRRASHQAWRIQSLDVLRGIAIIGTLLSNIWLFTSLTASDESLGGSGWQVHVQTVTDMVSNGKFLGLLSILFGVGMAIQFEAARRRGHRWPWRYEWRSLLLLADGFLHFALVFEFDILMGYALVAMVVAPLLLLRTRWLVLAAALVGAFHLGMEFRRLLWVPADVPDVERDVPFVPSGGGYFAEVADRVANFWDLRIEAFEIAPPLSAFLFLAGALLWRAGLFKVDGRALRMSVWLAVGGLGLGVPLTVWGHLGLPGSEMLGELSRYSVAPVVAFGYLGLVLLLLRRGSGHGFLSRQLAAVGRTALSCYMLQNIVAMVAFSSWGLAFGPLDSVGSVLAWAVISAILMLAATRWLRRFDQGPFEWGWKIAVDAPFLGRVGRRQARQENRAPAGAP